MGKKVRDGVKMRLVYFPRLYMAAFGDVCVASCSIILRILKLQNIEQNIEKYNNDEENR